MKIVVCLFRDKIKVDVFKVKRSKIINANIYLYLFNKKIMYFIFFSYYRIFYQLKFENTMLNILYNPSKNDSDTVS